ncbi:MAG: hypothetical protein VX641_00355 [Planctomycetota bacterium]|nr:hypothetical protein [Planctomycetota bacterium]
MTRSSDSILFGSALLRRLGVLALASGTCLLSGCLGDSELNEQKLAQTEIEAASTRYATLVSEVGVDKTPLAVADSLETLSRQLKAIKGTSGAQKKLVTKLVGQIAATSGKLRAMELALMDLEMRAARALIATRADSAMIIAAGADARMQTDFNAPAQAIAQQRDGLQQPHEQLRSENSALESKIAQVRQQRDRNSQQLDQMTTDSARLSRQANNVSAIDGYPLVEESSEIRARMIPIKGTIADAEIQLAGMQPELQRQQGAEMNAKALIDATHRAEANIASIRDAVIAAGESGRERARTQVGELEQMLEQYAAMQSEDFEPLFTATIDNLNQAQRAGNNTAERQIAGEATVLIGELHAMQAVSDAEDARLYSALANTSTITGVDPARWAALADEAAQASKAAIEEARTAYGDALEKLSRADGNEAALASIEQLIKALDGVRIEAPAPQTNAAPAAPNRPRRPGRRPPSGAGMNSDMLPFGTNGMNSPQALCDAMNDLSSNFSPGDLPRVMQQVMGMMYVSNPAMLPKLQSLQGAAMDQMVPLTPGQSLRVIREDGNRAVVGYSTNPADGLPLIRENGKWFIDLDGVVERLEQASGAGRGRN